jgi:hypothetical protein
MPLSDRNPAVSRRRRRCRSAGSQPYRREKHRPKGTLDAHSANVPRSPGRTTARHRRRRRSPPEPEGARHPLRPSLLTICIGHPDRSITGENVWCRWDGDHVQVHITFRNSSGDNLVATVRPNYWIAGHGRHGSSDGSRREVAVSAGAYRDWLTDAGRPKGVPAGTPIEKMRTGTREHRAGQRRLERRLPLSPVAARLLPGRRSRSAPGPILRSWRALVEHTISDPQLLSFRERSEPDDMSRNVRGYAETCASAGCRKRSV